MESTILTPSSSPPYYCMGIDEAGRGPLAGPVVCSSYYSPLESPRVPGVMDSKQLTDENERERIYGLLTNVPGAKYASAVVDAKCIDRINILQATMLGMRMAGNCLVEGVGGGKVPGIGIEGSYTWYEEIEDEGKGGKRGKGKSKSKGKGKGSSSGEKSVESGDWYALVDGNRFPNIRGTECPEVTSGPDMLADGTAVVKGDGKEYCIAAASVIAKVTRDRLMREYDLKYKGYGLGQHKGYGTREHVKAIYDKGVLEIHRRSFAPVKNMDLGEGQS
ncbi:hypothetical protein TrCOL_g12678 [Triparma columacea]|uniref:Ribonuclease n=1 Tax=Triparma columacea TaxID=722753 RepID=A0A9W7G5K4_9STRA|nr:hypothetical protein TrCOL_g12678 [Triparma columacea]